MPVPGFYDGDLLNSEFFGTPEWHAVVDDPRLDAEAKVAWLYCMAKAGGTLRTLEVTPDEIDDALDRNAMLVALIKAGGGRGKPR